MRRQRSLSIASVVLTACTTFAQVVPVETTTTQLLLPGQTQALTVTLGFNNPGIMTFVAIPPPPPVTIAPGAALTVVTGYTDNDVSSIDWYKDDRRIAGANGGSLTFASVKSTDSGLYHAVLHRNGGDLYTLRATVRVTVPVALPLLNLSSRVTIDSGNRTLISGFVVAPSPGKFNEARTVLIRGVGPSLAKFGVQSPLAKPRIRLFGSDGKEINESRAQVYLGYTAADLAATVGAFPLLPGTAEFQDYFTLFPGTYSIHLDSGDGGQGEALLEIYDVPASALQPHPPG